MNDTSIEDVYKKQIEFQKAVIEKIGYNHFEKFSQGKKVELPIDDIDLATYHIQGLMSEIGEVLNADKRWKIYRANNINMNNKLEEITDCFIFLMNIAIFSGFTAEEFSNMINKKIKQNFKRVKLKS